MFLDTTWGWQFAVPRPKIPMEQRRLMQETNASTAAPKAQLVLKGANSLRALRAIWTKGHLDSSIFQPSGLEGSQFFLIFFGLFGAMICWGNGPNHMSSVPNSVWSHSFVTSDFPNGFWYSSSHRFLWSHLGLSTNGGTPKSSILIGFSIINHPAIGDPPFMETPI